MVLDFELHTLTNITLCAKMISQHSYGLMPALPVSLSDFIPLASLDMNGVSISLTLCSAAPRPLSLAVFYSFTVDVTHPLTVLSSYLHSIWLYMAPWLDLFSKWL
jgi:hypothetical protein